MKKWIVPISLALALAACNEVNTVTPVTPSQSQQVKVAAAAWVTGVAYKAGDIVTYNARDYKCIQPHTSLAGWEPANVASLWQDLGATTGGDTTKPTASLSASSTSVTANGSVTFTATATDNVGVSKVEFYDGATLLATKTAAPFTNSISYTSANNGTKSYIVKAYDAAGNVTTSAAVSVVVNIPVVTTPSVTLTSSSTSVTTASTLTLTATPANVTPSKVEFYSGTTLIATKTAAPYTHAIALTSANNGAKTFTAKVYSGTSTTAVATSAAVNVNVNIATTTTPSVTLTSSSTSVTTASTLTLTATPSNVTPSKVEFYSGTTLIKTVTAAPYTHALALTSANNGAKTFTAKVYSGTSTTAAATSNAVNVNVAIGVADTTAPTASLAASSTNVTAAGSVTFTATATDNVGVSKVEFYEGATLLATKTAAPYTNSVGYINANNGTKSYTVKAYDAAGNVTTSSAVTVNVNIPATGDTIAPTVSLAASGTSTTFTTAGTLSLTATASDNVGVTKVEFYRGTTLIASDMDAPYSTGLNIDATMNGTQTFTAKAIDTAGNSTVSNSVVITVNVGGTSGGTPTLAEVEATEAALTSDPLFTTIKASIRTLGNAEVEAVVPGRAANPENVRRVEGILNEAKWDFYFPRRDPGYTYQKFLQAVAKFPAMCQTYNDGRNSEALCRRTLATMFAHFAQETGGHDRNDTVPEWRQALVYLREAGCNENDTSCGYNSECPTTSWITEAWPCGKTTTGAYQKYFGRGAKQLSYNFNYGPFSQAMFGDVRTLLDKPDLVASTWLNLASAVFFFVYPQPPKPSMLHVLDGTWKPNAVDQANGATNSFASTIMIINGGIECGLGYDKPQALNRISYYQSFAADLGVDITGEQLSCKDQKAFSSGGAGALNIYWEKDWHEGSQNRCMLVNYQTAYSALLQGDYKKCVEKQWGIVVK